jgi:hypothetical protein
MQEFEKHIKYINIYVYRVSQKKHMDQIILRPKRATNLTTRHPG